MIYLPPPAEQLPDRLNQMVRFANRDADDGAFLHPVVRAIVLHFWLAFDHPFEDGNGRTARALFYWAMLRHDYRLFEFVSISRFLKKAPAQYARAFLHTETDGNDLTYFIVHQVDVIRRAIDELDEYLKTKARQVQRVERMLRRSDRPEPPPARAARPRRPPPGRRVHDPVAPDKSRRRLCDGPRRSVPAGRARAPRSAADGPAHPRLLRTARPRDPTGIARPGRMSRADSVASPLPFRFSRPAADAARLSVIYQPLSTP